MPKGENPNSRANLKVPSSKEARELGAKGGKASAEARRANASLTEAIKNELTEENAMKIAKVVIARAKQGNLKAVELIRDTIGEKPKERVEHTATEIVIDFGDIEGDE